MASAVFSVTSVAIHPYENRCKIDKGVSSYLQGYDNVNYNPNTTSSEYRLSTCSRLRTSDLYILGIFSWYTLL